MKPLERSFDLADARAEILRVIRILGLKHELSVAGQRVFAAKCRLYDSSGSHVSTGLGKGDEQSAITGALFEAMEHYFTKDIYLNLEHLPSASYSANNPGVLSKLISSVIQHSHKGNIPCVSHDSLLNDQRVLYPLGLFMPNYIDILCEDRLINPDDTYDYSRLAEYSSNSGIAIGMNRNEALVHGLLEAAERDALSRFLFEAFIKLEPEALCKVNKETLPRHLRILVDDIAVEASAQEVSVYKLRNRFGIPTFCSWMGIEIFGIFQSGFGCSLNEGHAIERSLYELAQSYIAFTKLHDKVGAEKRNKEILANLKDYPSFLRCATFDIGRQEEILECQKVEYQGGKFETVSNLKKYLDSILFLFNFGNAGAFSVDFEIPVDTNVMVSHSFISESDHFMTVKSGRTPMPNAF